MTTAPEAETNKAKSPLQELVEKQRVSFKDLTNLANLIADMDTNNDAQAMGEVSAWVKKQVEDVIAVKKKPIEEALRTGKSGATGADLDDDDKARLQEDLDDLVELEGVLGQLKRVAAERLAEIKSGEPMSPTEAWAALKNALNTGDDAEGIALMARLMKGGGAAETAETGADEAAEEEEDDEAPEVQTPEEELEEAIKILRKLPQKYDEILIGRATGKVPGIRGWARSRVLARAAERKPLIEREEDKAKYKDVIEALQQGENPPMDLKQLPQLAESDGTVNLEGDKVTATRKREIIAQLIYMADIQLIKDPVGVVDGIGERQRTRATGDLAELREYVNSDDGDSELVKSFFEDRLAAVVKAFPEVEIDGKPVKKKEAAKKKKVDKDDDDEEEDEKPPAKDTKDKGEKALTIDKLAAGFGVDATQLEAFTKANLRNSIYNKDALQALVTAGEYNDAQLKSIVFAALDRANNPKGAEAESEEAAKLLTQLLKNGKKV